MAAPAAKLGEERGPGRRGRRPEGLASVSSARGGAGEEAGRGGDGVKCGRAAPRGAA